jgi:hypothetical protein
MGTQEENTNNRNALSHPVFENLLSELQEPRKEQELLKGLDAMFKNYFKTNRYFDNEDVTTEVLEAYHFCNYIIATKELCLTIKK